MRSQATNASPPTLTPQPPHPRLPTSHAPPLDHRRGHPPGRDPAGRGLQRSALVRGRPRARLRAELAARGGHRRRPRPRASLPLHPARRDARRAAAADPRLRRPGSTASPTSAPTGGRWSASTPGSQPALRCRYHGRRFAHDGRFLSMPEFEGAEGFPSPADDLAEVPFGTWGKLAVRRARSRLPAGRAAGRDGRAGLLAAAPRGGARPGPLARLPGAGQLGALLRQLPGGVPHPLRPRRPGAARSTTASTAPSSSAGPTSRSAWRAAARTSSICRRPRRTHGQQHRRLLLLALPQHDAQLLPLGDLGQRRPPAAPDRTRVSFLSYVWDPSRLDRGAGAGLDRVEREDEAVVESVQRGVRSRLYHRGRYSPAREQGPHHFHRLLERFLA